MVRAKDIILKEDASLHQFVLFDDDWYEDWNNPSGIALKDDRINTMQTADHRHLLVGPCDHRGITIVDNGADHSSSCKYCAYETSNEAHNYGDPVWTWGEDHATAVAKFTCSVCKHVETLNAAVKTEEFEATGEDPAKTVYTAKVTLAGQEYTDVVEMPHGLPNATITTEPEAKTLTYNGHEQQLLNAGTATGGQMLYALGDESGATEEFTETIPVGTDAGDYKVWYMVKGDNEHNDIPAKRVNAAIGKADFNAIEFTLTPAEATYTGSAIKPEVSGTFNPGSVLGLDKITVDASEYSFSYDNNVNAGTATVSITSSEKNFTGGTTNQGFEIKKAPNKVTVSIEGWAKGEEASIPDVIADFGAKTATLVYKVKNADDSTYSDTVPSEVGEYTVKATIAGSSNYEGGEATCDFEIIQKKYTVTFDPNEGTGTKEAESVAGNGSYILPDAATFGVPADKCRFSAWEVKIGSDKPVEKDPGDSITVTADTTVKALWEDHDWSQVKYTWSDDNSEATATRTCGKDGSHIETETVNTTSEVTKEATEEEDGERIYTAMFRNSVFEKQTKKVPIPKPEFVKVTFVGSSIDGDDEEAPYTVAEPYTVRIPKGTTIEDLDDNDQDKYKEIIDHFTKGKYAPYNKEVYMTSKPLSNYNSWSELEDDDQYLKEINEDTKFYIALCKAIDKVDITVAKPLCGTDMEDGPVVSVKDGSLVTLEAGRTKWWDRETGKTILSGTIEGEKTYGVRAYLDPVFGYGIDDDSSAPAITVENSDSDSVQLDAYGSMAKITFAVTADHDWNEISYEWSVDNKSVTATRTCKRDDKHVETETVNATSKVTKPATIDAKGETTYTSAEFNNKDFAVQKKTVEDIDKVDPTPLSDAIKAAKDAENGVKTSADGKDVDPADKYTTPAEKKALDDAIEKTQAVLDNPGSTQQQVDEAVAAIKKAKETYDAAKKDGKKGSVKPTPTPEPKPTPAPAKSTAKPVLVAKGISSGSTAVKVSWNKVSGADRYVVYLARCNYRGKTFSYKKIKTVNAKTLKLTKKKLKKNTAYKFYVVAQKKSGGSYKNVAKSRQGHFFTGNVRGSYTNPKNMKLSKYAYNLKKGKSATIKASVSKARAGKKLATNHAAKLRFTSNNPKVATVNAKGKVTAKAKGTAIIYVQTINGIWKTCKVTVK